MVFDTKRETKIENQFQQMYGELNDIQKLILISETYQGDTVCLALKAKLEDLNKNVWDAGIRLENYKTASEEFKKSDYYFEQKKIFNENQVTYLILLTQVNKKCHYTQPIISFFYQNSEDCKKCDDQSFVLSDVKNDLEGNVSIFSFDTDLNLSSVDILKKSFDVNELPCVIVNDNTFCGIQSKDFIMTKLCVNSTAASCIPYMSQE
jgi:hypothetical protein